MADDIYLPMVSIKWIAIAVAIGFISWGVTESIDSKYKAEAIAAATESWSKVVVACIKAGNDEDCGETYKMHIK